MFTFNLSNVINLLNRKQAKQKHFEPLVDTRYEPPSPGEIRQMINKLSRCSNCHFLIFDNYWSPDIEKSNIKACPTCGHNNS